VAKKRRQVIRSSSNIFLLSTVKVATMDGPIDTDETINGTVFGTFFSINSSPKKSGMFTSNMSRLTIDSE
jgi:hypothetical protein